MRRLIEQSTLPLKAIETRFAVDSSGFSTYRRSLVESTFMMLKAKFGDALRSKGDTAQVNELLCKVLCHNLCCVIQSMYELGVEPEF